MVYTFTDDFEDGDLVGWGNVGPAVTNTTSAAKNGLRGMRQVPDGTNNGVASLTDATLPDGYTYADVSFWFRQVAHTSGNSPVVTIQNRPAVNNADLYVNYGADGHMWWDIVGTDHAETSDAVVLGEWHQWRLVVYFGGTSWTLRVWRDGVQQPTVTSTGQSASDVKAIHFGGFAADPNTRDFDDVSVTLTTTDPVAAVTVSGSAALAALGAAAGAGLVRQQAAATLTGSSGLTAAGRQRIAAQAAVAAASTLTAAGLQRASARADLTASGALAAAGLRRVQASAALASVSDLSVTLGAVTGRADLAAAGALSAAGFVRSPATATLSASATLSAQALNHVHAAAAISASGILRMAASSVVLPGLAAIETITGTIAAAEATDALAAAETVTGLLAVETLV